MSTITFGGLNPSTEMVFGGLNVEGTPGPAEITAPTAPSVVLTSGDTTLTATWTVVGDGGSPITGWQYRIWATADESAPAPTQVGPGVSTQTWLSLVNDTDYTVQVAAINVIGTSPWAEVHGTPEPTPVPPQGITGLVLTPLNEAVTASWVDPADLGTGTITGYRVTVVDGQTYTYLLDADDNPVTLMALPNDVLLSVSVVVITEDGESAPVTGFVTPSETPDGTTPPGPVTSLTASAMNSSASLSWAAPAAPGTSAISDYLIQATDGVTANWYSATTTTAKIAGLSNAHLWSITVWARTGVGISELVSVTVTPFAGGVVLPSTDFLPSYAVAPPTPTPGPNPVFPEAYVPPDSGEPDVVVPPPFVPIPAPNIFAFYPRGTAGSKGIFSPDNWAGL